jgi:hypothetical protein
MLNVDLKEVVRQFELTLSKSGEFKDVKIVVADDEEDLLLLEVQNEGYCIELQFEDEEVGIAKRVVRKLYYRCSYPQVVSGGHWEPDDVDIVEFAWCDSIVEACIAIHSNSFAHRIDGIGEFENFERVYDIEQPGTSILDEDEVLEILERGYF